jgi:transposase
MSKPPKAPRKPMLSRDQRIKIHTLQSHSHKTYSEIAQDVECSLNQVKYAITHRLTPQKHRCGRYLLLSEAEISDLIDFVCISRQNRRMTWLELSTIWNCSEKAISNALKSEGFSRRIARKKPPISEANRIKRLAWAKEHLDWTTEQWGTILWTDETWVTGGRHTRTWVTRRKGEELNPTCIVDKIQRKSGWMFWGCFSGLTGKGPGLFWEKSWKTINKESYVEHTVPVIEAFIHDNPGLFLMQDHAPGHAAKYTIDELESRDIQLIFWPPYSPDLNPIETVWNTMKDWIQARYLDDKLSYKILRKAVIEAWDAIGENELAELLNSMPQRCQAVIDANGLYTKF